MKTIIRFLKSYTKKYTIRILIFIIVCFLGSAMALFAPIINGSFIDSLITNPNMKDIIKYSLFFLIIYILTNIVNFLDNRLYSYLNSKIGFDLNVCVLKHLHKIPISYTNQYNSIYLNERISSDSMSLSSFYLNLLKNSFSNIAYLIMALIIIGSFNFWLAIIIILFMPIYYFIYSKTKKLIFKENYKLREFRAKLSKALNEQIYYLKFIKINGLKDFFIERAHKSFAVSFKQIMKYQIIIFIFTSLDGLLGFFLQIAIVVLCGINIMNGEMTIGQLTIVLSYFSFLLNSIKYFFNVGRNLQENLTAYKRLQEILSIKIASKGKEKIKKINRIEMKSVSFSHDKNKLIDKFDFIFEKGKIYGVYGVNGAGKTSLIDLLLGLYLNEFNGEIKYNNVDIKNIDLWHLRNKCISISEQEAILIEDSIKENINLGKQDVIRNSNFNMLVNLFCLNRFLNNCEKGLNTLINEKSCNISGGENRKLSLIRAFLKEADLIVLDEPTTALDFESRSQLYELLKKMKSNKIIILVTHEKGLLDICDEKIHLK